jgi:acyl carrier protein
MMEDASVAWSRDRIRSDVEEILVGKLRGLNPDFSGSVTDDTRIMTDLGLESVSIVELCMSLGKHFRKKLPFQELVFRSGQFQDFSLGDMVGFLEKHLAA